MFWTWMRKWGCTVLRQRMCEKFRYLIRNFAVMRNTALLLIGIIVSAGRVLAINTQDTRMLSQPAVSADHIAFIYAEDLWVAGPDGSQPRRLTVSQGVESNPVFSPDGKTIAFTGQYDGNLDVYTIPVEGGNPQRLTWHPGADLVRGFTPDGKSVVFASQRASFSNRYFQLFTVPVTGGPVQQLPIPNAYYSTYSPDGSQMAYTPLRDVFLEWKHYRGGSIARIWLFNFKDMSTAIIPQPSKGCNDVSPVWIGGMVYFRSDRDGEFNVYSYNTASKEVRELTHFTDFPVLRVSGREGRMAFDQAGYLHLFDLAAGNEQRLKVGIAADLLELRPNYAQEMKYVRSGDISPSGARVVLDFSGDIVTVP